MSHSVLTCLALRCTLNFYRLVLSVIMARIDYKREVIAGVTDESSMARIDYRREIIAAAVWRVWLPACYPQYISPQHCIEVMRKEWLYKPNSLSNRFLFWQFRSHMTFLIPLSGSSLF